MSDLKNSILVSRQVPGFVREDHPQFVLFLEAYYEFLDQANGVNSKGKDLRYISDVDESLDDFEQQFFNSFLPFIPRDVEINKELIIKNIMSLYLSKGSEKSYRLLFRLLFGEEITIENPGRQILKASDGRWTKENFIRTELDVYSQYTSNGNTTIYYLPYVMDSSDVTVLVNDTVVTNYQFRKETQKIIFATSPSNNAIIKIAYKNFNVSILSNRKVSGITSNAYAIVERTGTRRLSGLTFFQLFIDAKTTFGTFANGELLASDVIFDGQLIPIYLQTYTDIAKITVLNGGSSYNIGDPVIIRGQSITPAYALVDDVTSGTIEDIVVTYGGAGFKINDNVLATSVSSELFQAFVQASDTSGANTSNTISFNIDVISDYASLNISNSDYGFPANTDADIGAVISTALTSNTINSLGVITQVNVATSLISSIINPQFFAQSSIAFANTRIEDLGGIGRIQINNGGEDYEVGDYLIFTNTLSFSGQGANAYVSNISATGAITQIRFNNTGIGYQPEYFPAVTVDSANGSNANLQVTAVMGGGEQLGFIIEDGVAGKILSIKVLESGSGYSTEPLIDLSNSGDGTAIASANLAPAVVQLSGRWITSDGILSDDQIKLQGRDYYINYSYVIGSRVEFKKYKSLLKNLLHPAGYVNYAKYKIEKTIESAINQNVVSTLSLTVPGRVSVTNNSNTITGTNTFFILGQTLGIIDSNTVIVVDDQTRNVVTISSNTSITVSNVFTTNANNSIIKIIV
jgi:hypothetical protein